MKNLLLILFVVLISSCDVNVAVQIVNPTMSDLDSCIITQHSNIKGAVLFAPIFLREWNDVKLYDLRTNKYKLARVDTLMLGGKTVGDTLFFKTN